MKKILFFLVFVIPFFSGCEPDSAEIEKETELLEITDLEILASGSLKLEATYTGSSQINSFPSGFLISVNEVPSQFSINIPATTSGKRTNAEAATHLQENEQYYAIAYIEFGQGNILYSEAESFVFTGSKSPEITEMNNSLIKDTVTIKGKYFTDNKNYLKVTFGRFSAPVIKSNDSIIQTIVPDNVDSHTLQVSVEVYGKKAIYNDFSLLPPSIEKISENTAALGDTLIVFGENFDLENSRNKIIIGDREATILNSSRESIEFIMPERASNSVLDLKLQAQLQEVSLQEAITIKKPEITGFPAVYHAYETIDITGNNFSIYPEDNKIFFADHQAEVLEASHTKLKVRIPIGPYEDRKPRVRIELIDYNVPYEGEFLLNDTWLLKSRINTGTSLRGHKHFIHNNKAYFFESDNEYNRWKVHVMDPTTDTWSSIYVPYPKPDIKNHQFGIIHNPDSDRIFFHFSIESHDFYEFFLDTKTFVERKDFPGVNRGLPATFSIKDRLYLGLGRFMDWGSRDREPLSYFWSYDINKDSWEQVATFPHYGERSDLSVSVIDGEAYIGNGASNTGEDDFWKYSPATDEWIKLANFPGARSWTSYFEYGGKVYVYYGTTLTGDPGEVAFEYDPATDIWKVIDPVNEFYYTYFIYPQGTYALRFENAVYLGLARFPYLEFFKADLNRL